MHEASESQLLNVIVSDLIVPLIVASGIKVSHILQKIGVQFVKTSVRGDHREEPAAPGKEILVLFIKVFLVESSDQCPCSSLIGGIRFRLPA